MNLNPTTDNSERQTTLRFCNFQPPPRATWYLPSTSSPACVRRPTSCGRRMARESGCAPTWTGSGRWCVSARERESRGWDFRV